MTRLEQPVAQTLSHRRSTSSVAEMFLGREGKIYATCPTQVPFVAALCLVEQERFPRKERRIDEPLLRRRRMTTKNRIVFGPTTT